jgi:hypothetical protein
MTVAVATPPRATRIAAVDWARGLVMVSALTYL